MKTSIKYVNYEALGAMCKNSRAGTHRRAWNCKVCVKQISGLKISEILEIYLGVNWRAKVMVVAGPNITKK